MARTVAIGKQDFASIMENHYFFVDKTEFIREWWESGDDVTLKTAPLWKNFKHEHGKRFFFEPLCEPERSV